MMTINKKIVLSATVLLLVFAWATACGSDNGGSTTSGSKTTQKQASDKDVETALRNAAMTEESHFTDAEVYTMKVSDIEKQGYKNIEGVELVIVSAGPKDYCIEAKGASGTVFNYNSKEGSVAEGRCT